MNKYILILMLCLTLFSCGKDGDNNFEITYGYVNEDIIFSSPEGHITVSFHWETKEEAQYFWSIYEGNINDFKRSIWKSYEEEFDVTLEHPVSKCSPYGYSKCSD